MRKFILWSLFFIYSLPANAMFCPNNFNSINIGDTLEQVKQQCGKPDAEKQTTTEISGPQEWSYYLKSANSINNSATLTLKMNVAFSDNKVININLNGISLTTTAFCGSTITVGDTEENVQSVCGKPAFVNKSQASNNTPSKITELKYNTTPPVKLIFLAGKLTKKE